MLAGTILMIIVLWVPTDDMIDWTIKPLAPVFSYTTLVFHPILTQLRQNSVSPTRVITPRIIKMMSRTNATHFMSIYHVQQLIKLGLALFFFRFCWLV